MNKLLEFYSDTGPERIGLVLIDGTILECVNEAKDPTQGFLFPNDPLIRLESVIYATFHTHPGVNSNLSALDYQGFQNWPDFKHIIIGNDGISCYIVSETGAILKDEASDYPARQTEEAVS